MTGTAENSGGGSTRLAWILLLGIVPIHFLCFYWWAAQDYYFSGDALYYFSRQVHSLSDLAARFLSVDELYQYRPLTYVFFSFVLLPLFGTHPQPYHVTAYVFSAINILLACAVVYYSVGRNKQVALFAAIFLLLNPVNFFPSFGPTFIDQWLSSFFYFATLLIVFGESTKLAAIAPVTFLLALLSKEHSIMLPVHATLVLLARNTTYRDTFKKTRNLWIVLTVFAAFQLAIRHGNAFAPEGTNPNLQFSFSLSRIMELLKGAKAAIFYPENYRHDQWIGFGRWIRLASLIPLSAAVLIAVKRRPRLAMAGIFWIALSLVPVAFLHQAPAPRHYYLALPGLAILFACAFQSWRAMAAVTPLLAIVTLTNVHLYEQESWIAVGARLTKEYLGRIETIIGETGRSSFYVIPGGDPYFYWHVDAGAALPSLLGRHATFRFAALKEPLETQEWLNNGVNVVLARNGEIMDALKAGQFPPPAHQNVCFLIRKLVATAKECAVLFRGQPLDESSGSLATPNHLPIFEVPEGVATLSRVTIRIAADGGLFLRRAVRLDSKSPGMTVELYGQRGTSFKKIFARRLKPGERCELLYSIAPDVFDHAVLRIQPAGSLSGGQNDWLLWER